MVRVTDPAFDVPGRTTIICDYSPPRTGDLSHLVPPPAGADFVLVNSSPGRSVRADSALTAAALKQQTGQEVIFALLTRDMNRLALQSHLLGAQLLGLENVVVAQGDNFSASDLARIKPVRDYRATELVGAISSMNGGRDFRGRSLAAPTRFCIGATFDTSGPGYQQVQLSIRKIEAGADFLVTQPIFDPKIRNDFERDWLEPAGELGPATMFWGLQMLEQGSVSFGNVPENTSHELERGRSGVEIALQLFEEMKASQINRIYLLPPILRGGERNYQAAQEFIAAVRASE